MHNIEYNVSLENNFTFYYFILKVHFVKYYFLIMKHSKAFQNKKKKSRHPMTKQISLFILLFSLSLDPNT